MWLTRVTGFAANCNLLASYTAHFFPAADEGLWRAGLITAVVLLLALINVRGIRQAAIASNFFTVGKLLPLLIFVAAGMFFLNASGFERVTHPGYRNFSTSVLLLIYAFTGFEVATVTAGESRDPTRDLPFAMILAIAGVAIIYVLIQVVCIGTLPGLATSERPLADAARNFLGAGGAALIALGALISIAGNLNGNLLAGSRLIYAMAEQRELPHVLARTHHRFRTPHVSILITSAIVLALALSGSFIYALTLSTITRLLTYVATSAALPILRSRNDAPPAAFRLRGGLAISILTLVLVLWLLSNSTWTEARDVAIAASIGLLIYIFYKLKDRRPPGV
jgi:amino acid transporter